VAFSVLEAPDAVSRVHVIWSVSPIFAAFQLIMHSHKDVSPMQFQVNACLFYNIVG